MPCVIILDKYLYDLVISTDDDKNIPQLYDLGIQWDLNDDDFIKPFNIQTFEKTGEFWITINKVICKSGREFYKDNWFRRVPMRLSLEEAKHNNVKDRIDIGLAYFKKKAISNDSELAPKCDFPEYIYQEPKDLIQIKLMSYYHWLTDVREKALLVKQVDII